MKNLKWKKRAGYAAPIVMKDSCELNNHEKPLFTIEKIMHSSKLYFLFSSVDTQFPVKTAQFKTLSKAKQVAELIYSDSKYAKRKS